jgi:hypothetical protein
VNDVQETIWKEEVMANFDILSQYSPAGTEKTNRIPQPKSLFRRAHLSRDLPHKLRPKQYTPTLSLVRAVSCEGASKVIPPTLLC